MSLKISSFSGKRPTFFFEKIIFPSTSTSKMPPLPSMSVGLTLKLFSISAARLEALGR
jgi:hypothetical protein